MKTPKFTIEKDDVMACVRLLNKEGEQVFTVWFGDDVDDSISISGQESTSLEEFETDLFWAQKALEIAKAGLDGDVTEA